MPKEQSKSPTATRTRSLGSVIPGPTRKFLGVQVPPLTSVLPNKQARRPTRSCDSSNSNGHFRLVKPADLNRHVSNLSSRKESDNSMEVERIDVTGNPFRSPDSSCPILPPTRPSPSEVHIELCPSESEALANPVEVPNAAKDTPFQRRKYPYSKYKIPKAEIVEKRVVEHKKKEEKDKISVITYKVHKDDTVPLEFRLLAVKPYIMQDFYFCDPFYLLMATVLLNKTHHKHALPAFNDIRKRWPTIEALSKVSPDELEKLIHHLGLSRDRSRRIIEMAQMWIKDPPTPDKLYRSRVKEPGEPRYPPTPISHFPGMGQYALDSWRLFCNKANPDDWKTVMPKDKELRLHLRWKWAANGKIWCARRGVIGPVTDEYLHALCCGDLSPLCTAEEWVKR